jgi:hypothetical protein
VSANEKLTFLTLDLSVFCRGVKCGHPWLGHTSKKADNSKKQQTHSKGEMIFIFLLFDLSIVDHLFGMSFLLRRAVNWILYTFIRYTMECGVKNLFNIRRKKNVARKPIATIAKII